MFGANSRARSRPKARGGRQWDTDRNSDTFGRQTRGEGGERLPGTSGITSWMNRGQLSLFIKRAAQAKPSPKPKPTTKYSKFKSSDYTRAAVQARGFKHSVQAMRADARAGGPGMAGSKGDRGWGISDYVTGVDDTRGGEGGDKTRPVTRSETPEASSKAPGRMVRGIQKKRGGAALGSARFTRKGIGGINRANNRKLGGI